MTRHLGATLFKSSLYQICKSHVAASMHHGTWGLMQAGFQIMALSTRPCYLKEMSRPFYIFLSPSPVLLTDPALGGYTAQIKFSKKSQVAAGMRPGTWGQQYLVGQTDCKVQIEDPAHHILMSRPLGATPAEAL